MSLIISLVVLFIMKIRFIPGKSIANIKIETFHLNVKEGHNSNVGLPQTATEKIETFHLNIIYAHFH